MDFSTKKVLVADPGGCDVEHAVRLARDFGKVYYYTPWQKQGPVFSDYAIGQGLEGLTNEKEFWKRVDEVDLICFFDVGFGDWAAYLRSHGYRVFGAGRGEELEQNRFVMRDEQRKAGMLTQKTEKVKGVTRLKAFLREHPGWYVKISTFRGMMESFGGQTAGEADMKIDKLAFELGPFKEDFEFFVEEPKEGLEPGFDTFFSKAGWTFPCMWGLGTQDYGYIATFTNFLPDILSTHMMKMSGILRKYDYRGAVSTELKTSDGRRGWMIDITARFATPACLVYTECIKNYPEVLWNVASGQTVTLIPTVTHVGCVWLPTNYTEKAWETLKIEPKDRSRVKFQRAVKHGGKYYAVMGEENGFVILGLGESAQAVIDEIKDVAERVSAQDLYKGGVGQLEKFKEKMKEAKKIGLEL